MKRKKLLRSSLGGHYAGPGTHFAFIEDEDTYFDRKERNVRMPSDFMSESTIAALSGPVIKTNLRSSQEG